MLELKTMPKGYDNLTVNRGLLLDLPFNEGIGSITKDIADPHHPVTFMGAAPGPTWEKVAISNTNVLKFVHTVSDDYLVSLDIDTADLNFTGDYSLACWVYLENLVDDGILIGRYRLDTDGWELYFSHADPSLNGYLTLRHHNSTFTYWPDYRTGCYSVGWFTGSWWFMGLSRSGPFPVMYRNGVALDMTYGWNTAHDFFGMRDPLGIAPNVQDLIIGARFTHDASFFKGKMWRPRAWNRALAAEEWQYIFETERDLFGV